MNKNLFISHSSNDKKVVEILANLIRRVSLNQIHIWFSNDVEINGGFLAGDNWFDTILYNLKNSQAVISFITPNSNNNPWIMYESGYAAALENVRLIPLKFLININDVSVPLQQKQIFSFSNIEEANVFLKKVLDSFGIVFDQEIFRDYINKCLNDMRNNFNNKENVIEENSIEILSKKIDSYFGILLNPKIIEDNKAKVEYEISISYEDVSGKETTEYIKINSTIRVSDVLDSVYCILNERVKAYKYLETWIIKEKRTNRYVVISDVQDLVPAMNIFRPNTKWEVEFLNSPYKPDNLYNSINHDVKMESFMRWSL